ncbi:hypothetical protein LDENG_00081260 [Lucifuga dentata]|nr:hypothetical protein LDENG_00081260 [Lucifuga dentata]
MRPMLLMLAFLLCCLPALNACLQCDRDIRNLHEDFILSSPCVENQIQMQQIRDQTYVSYRQTSQKRKGVIDSVTLYRTSTEYQNEFNRFMTNLQPGCMALFIMAKSRNILEKHLDVFIREGLCPNKCGLLNQRVMDCFTCRFKTYKCSSPSHQQDCGEHTLQAEEGGQAVLDCFLPWHRLVLGKPEYHYSWAPGVSGTEKLSESDFRSLVVTEDSSVVLNQLHVDETGTYRCLLQNQKGVIFSKVTFLLTVTPLPTQTGKTLTLPILPDADYSADNLLVPVLIAVVTALGLVASVGFTVVLGLTMNQRMQSHGRWEKKERLTQYTL